ncbi:hypothetical protein [Nodularia sp. NIES-3585]|nr:hypothetical protein [Nodularia sp. NIES-3585]GAX36912.1 hypothetical protein NIES3585_29510 [Nodularia sp. NIES-3585]
MEASGSSSYQSTIEKSIVCEEDPDPDLSVIRLAFALMTPPS